MNNMLLTLIIATLTLLANTAMAQMDCSKEAIAGYRVSSRKDLVRKCEKILAGGATNPAPAPQANPTTPVVNKPAKVVRRARTRPAPAPVQRTNLAPAPVQQLAPAPAPSLSSATIQQTIKNELDPYVATIKAQLDTKLKALDEALKVVNGLKDAKKAVDSGLRKGEKTLRENMDESTKTYTNLLIVGIIIILLVSGVCVFLYIVLRATREELKVAHQSTQVNEAFQDMQDVKRLQLLEMLRKLLKMLQVTDALSEENVVNLNADLDKQ